jgi:hypothetical protein
MIARMFRLVCISAVLLATDTEPARAGSVFDIAIDTTALSGSSAQLAFSFVSGDPASNTVTISEFDTDGLLGASFASGGVTGALPDTVSIADTEFFNSLLQNLTLGGAISFALTLTRHFAGPAPDQLALYLLDPDLGVPLFGTSDPTGADALFAVDITGTEFGEYQVFHSSLSASPVSSMPVAEPSSSLLLAAGAMALVASRRGRRT